MKNGNILLFISLLILGCKDNQLDQKAQNNKNVTTLESELTQAIENSAWIRYDYYNKPLRIIEFSTNNRFRIKSFEEAGDKYNEIDMKGDWHIENDYISIKYDDSALNFKWTIEENFSKIYHHNGAEYKIVRSTKDINLSLKVLKRKYENKETEEVAKEEYNPQDILKKIIAITGDFTQGNSWVNNVQGTSNIYFEQNNLLVDYLVGGVYSSKSGKLEDLALTKGPRDSYAIKGKWLIDNILASDFSLKIYDTKLIICSVYNSNLKWEHSQLKEVSLEKFNQIAELLNYKRSDFNQELKMLIENTVWETKPDKFGRVATIQFQKHLIFLFKSDGYNKGEWNKEGTWDIEEDYITMKYDKYKSGNQYSDFDKFWLISEDFSKITESYNQEYFLTSNLYNKHLDKLKRKHNYGDDKSHFNSYANKTDFQEDDSPQEYLDRNTIVEPKTKYKVQVKKGVVNVNVRDRKSQMVIDPNTPVITQVSDPEVYTVINYKNNGDRIEGEFELNRQLKLKDINSGEAYTLGIGKKVKLLETEYETVVYLAEVEVNNKIIKVKIPVQYVEPIYEEKWLYLKELKGWARSDFFKIIDDDTLDRITTKSNNDGTLTIGNQTWANKDLSVKKYANGDPIFEARNQKQWIEANRNKQGCFYILKNGTFIYNGYAVKDKRGIAPKGFSVPSITDFNTLFFNLGGKDKAEEVLTTYGWDAINSDYVGGAGIIDAHIKGDNSIGFNAEPGGNLFASGSPSEGTCNVWWTNSQITKDEFKTVYIGYCGEAGDGSFSAGNAIRAIKK